MHLASCLHCASHSLSADNVSDAIASTKVWQSPPSSLFRSAHQRVMVKYIFEKTVEAESQQETRCEMTKKLKIYSPLGSKIAIATLTMGLKAPRGACFTLGVVQTLLVDETPRSAREA